MKILRLNRLLSLVLVLVSVCSSFTTTHVLADEDQFEVNLTVTAAPDTSAPSVPTNLTATAVSSSQIDLSWTASTDNVSVTGYRIYRDNTLVSTVSTLSYSDIGLSPSTLYSYAVSAIDAASNESARSATSSATTFATPTSSGGGSGQYVYPFIYGLAVSTTETEAIIRWNTVRETVGEVRWGFSGDYELGRLQETIYSKEHQVTLSGLIPGQEYLFSITAWNAFGLSASVPGFFKMIELPEYELNATQFVAKVEDKSIRLNWNNPEVPFEEVRIVRGNGFYPSDPYDGTVIYEGKGESFLDTDVFSGKRYYYGLFVKDPNGRYSSGLLASGLVPLSGQQEVPEPPVFEQLPKAPTVHPVIDALSFLDFDFIQDGQKINTFSRNSVSIDGSKNLTVLLAYSKVPEILKSIVVTLKHPEDPSKIFSFLLRVNEDKTAYVATLGALGDSGTYGVDIAIVDYKNQGLKRIVGNLIASVATGYSKGKGFYSVLLLFLEERIFYLILILLLLLLMYLFGRNRKKKKVSGLTV